MDVSKSLTEAHRQGLTVEHTNSKLLIKGVQNNRDAELAAHLQDNKNEVLRYLQGLPEEECEEPPNEITDEQDCWPEPLDEAAHYGLVGDIVRTIDPHTEADEAAILIQTIVAFGNVIGKTAFFRAERDRHYGNLFTVLVGATSKGRKGSSLSNVREIMSRVDGLWCRNRILGGLSSGEGLIWAVRDPILERKAIKDRKTKITSYEDVETDAGVDDKRLLVLESEFSSVLKVASRERNTLSAIIRQAWDTGCLQTLAKNVPAKATDAHISIVGNITRDELRRLITETDMANGLANRFLWICVKRSKCLPEGGALQTADIEPLVNRMLGAVEFATGIGRMSRDDAARQAWAQVYPSLSHGNAGLLGAATSRAESQTMRLAMLYALLDRSTVITLDHLKAGLAVWEYAEQSARHVFGGSMGDATADSILDELRRRSPEGMTRNDIREHFQRNKRSDEIKRALDLLKDHALIRSETRTTAGRSAEVFFSVE